MRFFFYGTLIPGSGNPVSESLGAILSCLGAATARGRLYAVADRRGSYPLFIPGNGVVHGMVYETLPGFGRGDLARMDAYEDFDPRDRVASLYRRRRIVIRIGEGQATDADAYIYNRALPKGARIIAGGDFRAWLARTGAAPFGSRCTARLAVAT